MTVGRFIGAPDPAREVVFTKNATEGAQPGGPHLGPRPTSHAGRRRGAHRDGAPRQHRPLAHAGRASGASTIRWIPVDDDGRLVLDDLERLVDGAKLVGVHSMSNVLGTLNPIADIAEAAHRRRCRGGGRRRPVGPPPPDRRDAAGRATSWPSAPTRCSAPPASACCGAAASCLEAMPPFLGGGEMILDVRKDGFTANDIPWRFEAGTPPIAEAIGLGAAVDYLDARGHGRRPCSTRSR